jgi:Lipocalin-like domain
LSGGRESIGRWGAPPYVSLKEQLLGSWTATSWEQANKDGTKFQRFGANPKGVNMFDANGRFFVMFARADLPKNASAVWTDSAWAPVPGLSQASGAQQEDALAGAFSARLSYLETSPELAATLQKPKLHGCSFATRPAPISDQVHDQATRMKLFSIAY